MSDYCYLCMVPAGTRGRQHKASCNYEHIAIAWTHPGPCPLCACLDRVEELESAQPAIAANIRAALAWKGGA